MEHLGALSLRRLALTSIVLCALLIVHVSGAHQHGRHAHLHARGHAHEQAHHHAELHARGAAPPTVATSAAASLVDEALAALQLLNKARVENPRFNKYELRPSSASSGLAPALSASSVASNGSTSLLHRRQQQGNSSRNNSNNSTIDESTSYSISAELAEAARILAEATPQIPSGNHSEVAAAVRKKYAHATNDTNVPPSAKTPEGRLSAFGDDDGHEAASASKRADEWWMVAMGSSGTSPLAPDGYKVWRNVRDYGAKGDGVTDDTAAINLAVSDGGRCGPGCGSSTIYPVPENNQQGIYMENGSGGFLADLTFVGGHFGAYFGNQQFTTSHLVFVNAVVGLQVHWDWAWTMQDFIIESCGTGLIIVGGAGGAQSTGQGVGSLILVDAIIANTPLGIVTTLFAENTTSFLLQNVGFFNTQAAITDSATGSTLLAGGNEAVVGNWGFGRMTNATTNGTADDGTTFVNGATIPVMERSAALVGDAYSGLGPNLFTRRRPGYADMAVSKVMNVRALGAAGDGVTDDTSVLNSILEGAANTSSVVFVPYGLYLVTDTLRVPAGSRIVGQAWPQIMGTGAKFSDESQPRAIMQVGRPGDIGIAEISSIMVTVRGPTAGAVAIEWNIAESSTGAAGMWDTHVRIGGAAGSDLSVANCFKQAGIVNPRCKAASLLMHVTANATVYLENVWLWTADHDLDSSTLDQIDIYAGRGLLIEGRRAWLWGTSVEHCVLYQYQLSNAQDVVMAMVQTESPYFQPVPLAPAPFATGLFANDPTFTACVVGGTSSSSARCAVAWAMRIVDSSSVYLLGAGLYSWFVAYDQDCLATGDCQDRGLEVQQSRDIWIYNRCTKAIREMVSPLGSVPTYASDNVNGFLSSVLAWLQGSTAVAGERAFPGYRVWTAGMLDRLYGPALPQTCRSALTELIACDNRTEQFQRPGIRSWLGTVDDTDAVCAASCGTSLKSWFDSVALACAGYDVNDALPTLLGGRIWNGWNQTCLTDPATGKYCGEIIDGFSDVDAIEDMPPDELCSYCWVEHYALPQRSPYSNYDAFLQSQLEYTVAQCGRSDVNTSIPDSALVLQTPAVYCQSDQWYTTVEGDTCDSIAQAHSLASASIYFENPEVLYNCSSIAAGTSLCLPPACSLIWTIEPDDTCVSLEKKAEAAAQVPFFRSVKKYNRWVDRDCTNLQSASDAVFGHVVCLTPQSGLFTNRVSDAGDTTTPASSPGYSSVITKPPANTTVAAGTALACGTWHVAAVNDTCSTIVFPSGTTITIFLKVNPSLGTDIPGCTGNLVIGKAYCALPFTAWDRITI